MTGINGYLLLKFDLNVEPVNNLKSNKELVILVNKLQNYGSKYNQIDDTQNECSFV